MGGLARKLQRQKAKAEGTLEYKKVAARKLGISVSEYLCYYLWLFSGGSSRVYR